MPYDAATISSTGQSDTADDEAATDDVFAGWHRVKPPQPPARTAAACRSADSSTSSTTLPNTRSPSVLVMATVSPRSSHVRRHRACSCAGVRTAATGPSGPAIHTASVDASPSPTNRRPRAAHSPRRQTPHNSADSFCPLHCVGVSRRSSPGFDHLVLIELERCAIDQPASARLNARANDNASSRSLALSPDSRNVLARPWIATSAAG